MDRSIEVSHLVRRFGSFTAVDHVSFDARRGEVFSALYDVGRDGVPSVIIDDGARRSAEQHGARLMRAVSAA